jgi:hypothetical protein
MALIRLGDTSLQRAENELIDSCMMVWLTYFIPLSISYMPEWKQIKQQSDKICYVVNTDLFIFFRRIRPWIRNSQVIVNISSTFTSVPPNTGIYFYFRDNSGSFKIVYMPEFLKMAIQGKVNNISRFYIRNYTSYSTNLCSLLLCDTEWSEWNGDHV